MVIMALLANIYGGLAAPLQSVFDGVTCPLRLIGHMKWLFRSIILIITVFVALCIAGAFMPAQQRVDASIVLESDVLSVYEIISDLRSYPEWSGIGGSESEWVFGGADIETGQTAAWHAGQRFGSLEILQAEPGRFVVLKSVGQLGEQTISLALNEADVGTSFLIEAKRDLGGFPYFSRIASISQKSATRKVLERATEGLAQMVES